MFFRTTASNTGPMKRACVAIGAKLNQSLLDFACKDSANEIIVSGVLQKCFSALN